MRQSQFYEFTCNLSSLLNASRNGDTEDTDACRPLRISLFSGTSDETSGSILHANFLADENSPDLSHERHKAKVTAGIVGARARTRVPGHL